MSTDTKSGKGRKLCGQCGNYVASVTKVCSCGYDFKSNKKPVEVKEAVTYDQPGKGRKLCSGCQKYVAAPLQKCSCGHDFAASKKPATVKAVTNLPQVDQVLAAMATRPARPLPVTPLPLHRDYNNDDLLKICAPGGDCPVKLKGTSIEEVASWGDAVKTNFRERQMYLSTSGLIYFARKSWGENQGFEFTSAEFALVKNHLIELYGSDTAL